MPVFALAPQSEQQNADDIAVRNSHDPNIVEPGFFDNSFGAIGSGLKNSVAGLGVLAADVAAPWADQNLSEEWKQTFSDVRSDMIDIHRDAVPDPKVTGFLGNVLHGVSSVIPQYAIGSLVAGPLGGATLVGAAQGTSKAEDLVSQGVDPETAGTVGLIEGVTQGAGVLLPAAIPGRLTTRLLSGAAMNVGVGGVQRGLTGHVLESNGYKEMGEQYRVLDGTQIFTDAVLGSIFGVLHRGAHPDTKPLPSEVDAAMAGNNVHNLELESAPGIPTDLATRNAHVDASDTAIRQLLAGEEVNVSGKLDDANLIPKPVDAESTKATEAALKENGIPELVEQNAKTNEMDAEGPFDVQKASAETVGPDGLTHAQALEEAKGFLDTSAKPYTKKRVKLQEKIADELYGTGAPEKGGIIDFIMGPPGAGKSSVIANTRAAKNGALVIDSDFAKEKLPEFRNGVGAGAVHVESKRITDSVIEKAVENNDNIVMPVIGGDYAKMRELVDKFKGLGYTVNTFLVHVPKDVAHKRAIQRFAETGRLVPPDYIEGIADKPIEVYNQIVKEGLVNERTHYDNNVPFGEKPRIVPEEAGLGDKPGLRGPDRVREGSGAGVRKADGEAGKTDPGQQIIDSAEAVLAERPDMQITDDDGNVVSAAEALAKVDEEIAQAEKDSSLFDVAVNCFLRNGE